MKNLKKINQKSLFFLAGVLVVVAVLVSLNLSDKVFGATGGGGGGGGGGIGGGAGATCTLTGFAWSGYKDKSGIGWIGFGPQNNFRVNVDSNGLLNGHAWIGDNTAAGSIGWVKFGGLSGFPNGGGTEAVNATLDWESGKMSGWARACSVFQNGCSGTLKNDAYRGGWDGWISLSGTTADGDSYDVSWNSGTQQFEGYAWGSKEVAGWISFAGSNYGVTFTTNTCKNAVGDGGGGFDYSVDIETLIIPSNESNTVEHPVKISNNSSSVREVSLLFDVINSKNNFGDELTITKTKDNTTSCTPPAHGSCLLFIEIEYTTVNGSRRSFSTQNIPTQSEDIKRDGKLDITILGEGEAYCYPDRSFALINTPITWTVEPGDDLKNPSYEWSGSEELSGEGKNVEKEYSSTGIKSASVKITHDAGEQTIICSPTVLIFSDILFEHL